MHVDACYHMSMHVIRIIMHVDVLLCRVSREQRVWQDLRGMKEILDLTAPKEKLELKEQKYAISYGVWGQIKMAGLCYYRD